MSLSKQFTQREKVLMAILAVLLVFATYIFAVHQPVTQSLERLREEQWETEDELLILQAKQLQLTAMRTELEAIFAQPNVAESPKYDNLQPLMVFLNSVLSATTDYNLSFQPIQTEQDARVVRRVISMSFTCPSYPDARTVAERLRDGPFRCQLGNLSIAPVGTGEASATADMTAGEVQVSLSVTFFESLG